MIQESWQPPSYLGENFPTLLWDLNYLFSFLLKKLGKCQISTLSGVYITWTQTWVAFVQRRGRNKCWKVNSALGWERLIPRGHSPVSTVLPKVYLVICVSYKKWAWQLPFVMHIIYHYIPPYLNHLNKYKFSRQE